MYELDPSEAEERESARIIKSAVTPRPIAWISTTGENGVDNLAPFSSYNYVSTSQPVVLFNSPYTEDREPKDTARNAVDTEEFVVNVVTEDVIEEMDTSSASIPADESEFDYAGVERAPSKRVAPPRVANAVVSMECTLYDAIQIRDRLMVLGDVVYFHVSEEIMTDGEIDMEKFHTIGRLGGPFYTKSVPMEFERQF